MTLAFLALAVLTIGDCDWPPQDHVSFPGPMIVIEITPAAEAAAYARAESAIANDWNRRELHLDGGSMDNPAGLKGFLSPEEMKAHENDANLQALTVLPPSIANLDWLQTLTLSYTCLLYTSRCV